MYQHSSKLLLIVTCTKYGNKTKKFGCVGRGNPTLLFFSKVVKYIKVTGDLPINVEDNKSFTSLPSGLRPVENNATALI